MKRKHEVLDRYERAPGGVVIIDVTANQVEDLYNDYDRSTPFIRRDLNQELLDYLVDSAREVGRVPFIVRFTLAELPRLASQLRTSRSVRAYFTYLQAATRRGFGAMLRKATIRGCMGIALLFAVVLIKRSLQEDGAIVPSVVLEGLTIISWLSLWEAVALLLVEGPPSLETLRIYRRLAEADLVYRPHPLPAQKAEPSS
jgi:hypothetical protein